MPYRFVHTADLHLDSPLGSLAMRDPALAERIDAATRASFERIVDHCLDERVDALMIAGDLYDRDQTSVKTAIFLASQLGRLHEAGIRAFIVRGNHDSGATITRGLDLPPGVHVFDGRGGVGQVARDAGEGGPEVRVHGVSFGQSKAPDSLLPKYARPTGGAVEIGLMHTSLGGDAGHDTYAPCALADLVGHGFAYWGLGHVHARTVHHRAGDAAVVMPGMPQGRDIGEAGAKSATLVTIGDDGALTLDAFATAVAEFARERVVLGPEAGWSDALERAEAAMVEAAGRTSADHLVVRLSLTGASHEAWRLRRDLDLFTDELRDRVGGPRSGLHVDKVELDVAAAETKAAGADSLGAGAELAALMAEEAESADFLAWARAHADRLRGTLNRRELRDAVLGEDEGDAAVAEAIAAGVTEIAARMEGGARARPGGEA